MLPSINRCNKQWNIRTTRSLISLAFVCPMHSSQTHKHTRHEVDAKLANWITNISRYIKSIYLSSNIDRISAIIHSEWAKAGWKKETNRLLNVCCRDIAFRFMLLLIVIVVASYICIVFQLKSLNGKTFIRLDCILKALLFPLCHVMQ